MTIPCRFRLIILLVLTKFMACEFSIAQAADDSLWITPKALVEAGVHLPSYMDSVDQQLSYQGGLPTHQELTLEWNSLPGNPSKALRKEETEGQPLRGDFRIVDRHERVKGGSVSRPPMFMQDQLVAVAVSTGDEVRGLIVLWDPRTSHSEDVKRGKREDFVTPSVSFKLWLPDDPQIRKVIFFKPVPGESGKPRLERIGEIVLEATHIPPALMRP